MTSSLTNAEKREIWADGYAKARACSIAIGASDASLDAEANREALRRYPDPKEPTVLAAADGRQYRIVDGYLQIKASSCVDWQTNPHWPVSLCLALGEIAQEAQQEMGK